MHFWEAFREYYSQFGGSGILLLAKARLHRAHPEALIDVPSFRFPIHLRFRTTDVPTFRQVIRESEYDWEFARLPRVIVDCGANIGLTSVFYSNKYPEAKIIAVEPESSNFEVLKKNTKHYPNVTPIHAALWKTNGKVNLVDFEVGHDGFMVSENCDQNTGRSGGITSLTVDKILEDFRLPFIDILKIDIEGAETEVFEHASSWIQKVGVIVIELHDRMKSGCSRSVYAAVHGFEFEWRKHGTVFFLRKEYVMNPQLSQRDVSEALVTKKRSIKFRARTGK
jgi:FkbM family methyltransferase